MFAFTAPCVFDCVEPMGRWLRNSFLGDKQFKKTVVRTSRRQLVPNVVVQSQGRCGSC